MATPSHAQSKSYDLKPLITINSSSSVAEFGPEEEIEIRKQKQQSLIHKLAAHRANSEMTKNMSRAEYDKEESDLIKKLNPVLFPPQKKVYNKIVNSKNVIQVSYPMASNMKVLYSQSKHPYG